MLDLSAADALIWNDKYYWNWWRPITAIRQAWRRQSDDDQRPGLDAAVQCGLPDIAALPDHHPLPIGGVGGPLSTPPYPDRPSGATARQRQYGCPGVILRD